MHLDSRKSLSAVAILGAVTIGMGISPVLADTAEQPRSKSQMNHEQMMNDDDEQMPIQECFENSDTEMNHEQMVSSNDGQMPIQECSDNSDAEMNHGQMMNAEEHQMPIPDDATSPDN